MWQIGYLTENRASLRNYLRYFLPVFLVSLFFNLSLDVVAQTSHEGPLISMAGYGTSPLTVSAVEGGSFTLQAKIIGGEKPYSAEAMFNFTRDDGETDSFVFGFLTDPDGDDVYELTVNIEPNQASVGEENGVRLIVTDANGQVAIWPNFVVPLSQRRILAVQVEPAALTLTTGEQTQLTVEAIFNAGAGADISGQKFGTTYNVHDPAIARVDADGAITALSPGTTFLTVQNNGNEEAVGVIVEPRNIRLVELRVSPSATISLDVGGTVQLTVLGRFEDGEEQDLTMEAATAYGSNDAGVATVSASGLVTAIEPGTAIITVSNGEQSDIVGVEVVTAQASAGESPDDAATEQAPEGDSSDEGETAPEATLAGLSVEASDGQLLTGVGETLQITVNGLLSDGTTSDLTAGSNGTTYTSSDVEVVEVTEDGLIRSINQGSATVIVRNSGFEGSLSVSVEF